MNTRENGRLRMNIQLFAAENEEENVATNAEGSNDEVPDEPIVEPDGSSNIKLTTVSGATVITKRRPSNVTAIHDMNSDDANEFLFREIGKEIAVGKDVIEEQLINVSINEAKPGKQEVVTLPMYKNLRSDFDNIGLPFAKGSVKRSIKPTNVGEMVIGVITHLIPQDMVEEFEVVVDDKPFTRRILNKPTYVPRQLVQNIRQSHTENLYANIELVETESSKLHEDWVRCLKNVYSNRDNSQRVPVMPRFKTYALSSRHNNALENKNLSYVNAYLKDNKAHINIQCKSIDNRANVNLTLSSFNFANVSHDILHMIANAIENIEKAFECYNESIKMLLKEPTKYGTFLDNTALSGVRSITDPILALRGDNKKCDTYVDLLTSGFYKRFYGKFEKLLKESLEMKFPRYKSDFIERVPICQYDAEDERLIVSPQILTNCVKSCYYPSKNKAPIRLKSVDANYTTLSDVVYDPFYVGLAEALNTKQYDLNTANVLRKLLSGGLPVIFNPYQPAYAMIIIIASENILNHCERLLNMIDKESYDMLMQCYSEVFDFFTGTEIFNHCDLELLRNFAKPKSNITYRELLEFSHCNNFIDKTSNLYRRFDAANFTQIPQVGTQSTDEIEVLPSMLFHDRRKNIYTTQTAGTDIVCPYLIHEVEEYGGIADINVDISDLYDFLVNDVPFGMVNANCRARSSRTHARNSFIINKDITYLQLLDSSKRSSIAYDIIPSALFPFWYLQFGMIPMQYAFEDGLSKKIFCDKVEHVYVDGQIKMYNDYFNERFAQQSDTLYTCTNLDDNILKRREICNVVPIIFIIRCGTMNSTAYNCACNRRALNYHYLQNTNQADVIKTYLSDSIYPLFEINEGIRFTASDLRPTTYNEILDKDVDFGFISSEQIIYPSNIKGLRHKIPHIRYESLTSVDGVFNKVPGVKSLSQVALIDMYCFDEYKFNDAKGYPVFIVSDSTADGVLTNDLEEILYNNKQII